MLTLRSSIHPWGVPALLQLASGGSTTESGSRFLCLSSLASRADQPARRVGPSVLGPARCSVGFGCWMQDAVLVPYHMEHHAARARTIPASLLMATVSRSALPGQCSRYPHASSYWHTYESLQKLVLLRIRALNQLIESVT